MKNNNNSYKNNNNHHQSNNNHHKINTGGGNNSHDRKNRYQNRQNQQQSSSSYQEQTQEKSHQHPQQQQHHYQNQRDRSSQRNQHPDSSMSRSDNTNNYGTVNPTALGSIRFTPSQSTRDLPPIETKADPNKKFTGRCRLFVGNLPHNTSEDKLKALFEPFGEVGEVFLGPKSAFAFVKMDTRQNAEAARDALDCSNYENRTLRVRLAAHAAAIRVKHLSPTVTNELLAYAFRYFGEIERAVVVVDDKGKSIGEGVVEYSRKQSAQYAIKRCQQDCFMLTASPMPVLVEPFDQQDEDEGLPEKSVNRSTIEYKEQRDVGPRFAEQGSFEHSFATRWKELYEVEKQKREHLEQEIQEARKNLNDQIEYSRLEHDTIQLRSKLQQLEDNRMKLQQMKEQNVTDSQQRDEQRRQQDLLIRQREEEVLRRQQLSSDPNGLNQQENALRMQASALQNLLNNQERNSSTATITLTDTNSPAPESLVPTMTMSQPTMPPFSMSTQPRTFADVAMMGQQQQAFLAQPQMAMQSQTSQPNMFTPYIPQQFQQPNTMPMNPGSSQYQEQPFQQAKYDPGNNINIPTQRPRKRGRY